MRASCSAFPDYAATLRAPRRDGPRELLPRRADGADRRVLPRDRRVLLRDDFRNYHPEWVEPITQDYRGYTVCEIPPNGHGITVLMALGILNGMTMPEKRESAEHYHKVMEAIKLAFADYEDLTRRRPAHMKTKVSELLIPPISPPPHAHHRPRAGAEGGRPTAAAPSISHR